MRDGVRLLADVYRPAGAGPHPVLLLRVPYSKDLAQTVVYAHPYWYARQGFIVVVQDTRGRHRSEGSFTPWDFEAVDGYDTVEWAARLAGSNGRVGMYGFSYSGAAQLQAAALRPPHLHAIAPAFTSLDFYGDWLYPGGALSWAFVATWATVDLAAESARREDLPEVQERLARSLLTLPDSYWFLPVDRYPHLPEEVSSYVHDWLAHPSRDQFWVDRDEERSLPRIDTPALHIGGWSDVFVEGTLRGFSRLKTETGAEQRLLVGPWMHMPWTRTIAGLDVGEQGDTDIDAIQLRWFARWLKSDRDEGSAAGVDNSGDPVRVFTMGRNQWSSARAWSEPARTLPLYLHGGGRANSRYGDGELRHDPPAGEAFDVFVYDPKNPVQSLGGRSCCAADLTPMGVVDQRVVEERNDVLVFTSSPLNGDVVLQGSVRLHLWAATSTVDTDFTAKLVDVDEQRMALNVVDGIVRGRHREAAALPSLLEPDLVYEFVIALGSICWAFEAGHRIRLQVSSSNFPRFNRNGNVSQHPNSVRFSDLKIAVQRVFHDHDRPSHLELPVISGGGALRAR